MAENRPRYTRPWGSIGLGWLCAVAALAIMAGTLIPLWQASERLDVISIILLALAWLL